MKRLFALLSLAIVLTACGGGSVTEDERGVTVRTSADEQVRLEVVKNNVIKVSVVEEDSTFHPYKLPVVGDIDTKAKFSYEKNSNSVTLKTSDVRVAINRLNGKITFYPAAGGDALLAESRNYREGKGNFRRMSGDANGAFSASVKRTEDGRLYTNILSGEKFQIVADSCSLSRWNNLEKWKEFGEVFKLTADGQQGVKMCHTTNEDRVDEAVNEDFQFNIFAKSVPRIDGENTLTSLYKANTPIIWCGELTADKEGIYSFMLECAGEATISLGDKRYSVKGDDAGIRIFEVLLKADTAVPFRLECKQGVNTIKLKAMAPNEGAQIEWLSATKNLTDYYFIIPNKEAKPCNKECKEGCDDKCTDGCNKECNKECKEECKEECDKTPCAKSSTPKDGEILKAKKKYATEAAKPGIVEISSSTARK